MRREGRTAPVFANCWEDASPLADPRATRPLGHHSGKPLPSSSFPLCHKLQHPTRDALSDKGCIIMHMTFRDFTHLIREIIAYFRTMYTVSIRLSSQCLTIRPERDSKLVWYYRLYVCKYCMIININTHTLTLICVCVCVHILYTYVLYIYIYLVYNL